MRQSGGSERSEPARGQPQRADQNHRAARRPRPSPGTSTTAPPGAALKHRPDSAVRASASPSAAGRCGPRPNEPPRLPNSPRPWAPSGLDRTPPPSYTAVQDCRSDRAAAEQRPTPWHHPSPDPHPRIDSATSPPTHPYHTRLTGPHPDAGALVRFPIPDLAAAATTTLLHPALPSAEQGPVRRPPHPIPRQPTPTPYSPLH